MSFRRIFQIVLTKIGASCSQSQIRILNAGLNYLEVGRWLKANGFDSSSRYETREAFYMAVAETLADEPVLYLEFGVYQGTSLRIWSKLLKNPDASLHGFDSFEGLPADWDARRPKGTFDVGRRVPVVDDERVSFHCGWFEETLPLFVLPAHERIVLNMDADLYSSTKFVLDTLRPQISRGTIIIFDEFCNREHELRAFSDFLTETSMEFRVVAATENLERVAFERTN